MSKEFAEHLLSLPTSSGITLHAYWIEAGCVDAEAEGLIRNQLCDLADLQGWGYLPVLLQTRLEGGGEVVREVLRVDEKATRLVWRVLAGKDGFHYSIFAVPTGCPADDKLMGLH